MTTAAHLIFTRFDEYLKLESGSEYKHEWINGHVYAMSRGTPEHGRLYGGRRSCASTNRRLSRLLLGHADWISEVKRGGETIRIHGSAIAVDSIYG
jgi:hypothetical protein